ncbi:hypothetical protein [Legionella fallonii]|nr:hypothetical protein [Legionella fallonii]
MEKVIQFLLQSLIPKGANQAIMNNATLEPCSGLLHCVGNDDRTEDNGIKLS